LPIIFAPYGNLEGEAMADYGPLAVVLEGGGASI